MREVQRNRRSLCYSITAVATRTKADCGRFHTLVLFILKHSRVDDVPSFHKYLQSLNPLGMRKIYRCVIVVGHCEGRLFRKRAAVTALSYPPLTEKQECACRGRTFKPRDR